MLTGFLLVICAGLCWIGIGITVSVCTRRGWNYDLVQGLSYIGSAVISALVLLCGAWPTAASGGALAVVFGSSFIAGIANFYSYVLAAKAMRIGPNGLIWGIMQAGMIGSTLMGICFFGEAATLPRLTGLLLIVVGVFVMGFSRDPQVRVGGKLWLIPALGAFSLVVVGHCGNSLSSFFPETMQAGSVFRTFTFYVGGVTGFAITALPQMIRSKHAGTRGEWITAAVLMLLCVISSFFFLFPGVDLLAGAGAGGLGFLIANGVCVAGFSLYSLLLLKEKIARLGMAGLAAVCIGIATLTIR